jgi:hypothetical protein
MSEVDYREPGAMTKAEMREWMANIQTRLVNDLCLVAWGYHPESIEGKAYDFTKSGGSPERLRNGLFAARMNSGVWIENIDDAGFCMDRNMFAEWLKAHPSWRKEQPCIRFINAWKEYRAQTEYPDTKPQSQIERIRRAVDAVREVSGVAEVNAAVRLILENSEYTKYKPLLTYSKGPNKGKLMSVQDAASAYSAKPSHISYKNPVGKK